MGIQFLHLSEILSIHRFLLQRFGGVPGERDIAPLNRLVRDFKAGAFTDVVEGFGAIVAFFLREEPFEDGNRRTAFAVADVFLRINGCYLAVDAAHLACRAAVWFAEESCGGIVREDVRQWLADTRRGAPRASVLSSGSAGAADGLAARLAPYAVIPPPRPPERPFQDTVKEAFRFQQDSVTTLREVFREIRRSGRFKLQPVKRVVKDLVRLVGQNAEAMLAMYSLYTTDIYTYRHCINVATLSMAFGAFLGCTQQQMQELGMAGFLHDVGKQFIPPEIINAPRRLTHEEFRQMQRHPILGYELLRQFADIPESVRLGVLDHHEKADGAGYPDGKQAKDISSIGAVIAVVDTYDALSHDRVYRAALPPAKALSVLYSMREAFLPHLAERFIRCIGVYPVGSLVRLSSGDMAVVCEANPSARLKPKVALLGDSRESEGTSLHLLDMTSRSGLSVTDCLDPRRYGVDCPNILNAAAHLAYD